MVLQAVRCCAAFAKNAQRQHDFDGATAESDVDIVVRLDETFYRDLSLLTAQDRTLYDAHFGPATYTYDAFKADVVKALRAAFGAAFVEEGPKAVWITTFCATTIQSPGLRPTGKSFWTSSQPSGAIGIEPVGSSARGLRNVLRELHQRPTRQTLARGA